MGLDFARPIFTRIDQPPFFTDRWHGPSGMGNNDGGAALGTFAARGPFMAVCFLPVVFFLPSLLTALALLLFAMMVERGERVGERRDRISVAAALNKWR